MERERSAAAAKVEDTKSDRDGRRQDERQEKMQRE